MGLLHVVSSESKALVSKHADLRLAIESASHAHAQTAGDGTHHHVEHDGSTLWSTDPTAKLLWDQEPQPPKAEAGAGVADG